MESDSTHSKHASASQHQSNLHSDPSQASEIRQIEKGLEEFKISLSPDANEFVPGAPSSLRESEKPQVIIEEVALKSYKISEDLFQGNYSHLNYLVNNQLHCFNYQENTWTAHTLVSGDPKVRFSKYSQAIFTIADNVFYVIGGLSKRQLAGKRKTLKVRIAMVSGQRAEEVDNDYRLNQGRYLHSCVIAGGKIYAIGGQSDPKTYLKSVEVLDNSGWSSAPSLNIARSNFTSFVYNDAIYVAGGFSGTKQLSNFVEKLEIGSGSWQVIELPVPMYAGMALIPTKRDYETVWLVGGFNGDASTNRVIEFNAKTHEVSETGKNLLFPVSMGATCWYANYNYWVFSGGVEVLGQKYEKGTWSEYKIIPQINHIEAASYPTFRK
jgi:hypothetical protein